MNCKTYEEAGVNVEQAEQFVSFIKGHASTAKSSQQPQGAGGYAAIHALTPQIWIASTTDGVGTKVLLANQFNQHRGIGQDLVAMCANDLICVGARPIQFLDYYATGKLELEPAQAFIEGLMDACLQAGMTLAGGETAEMPGVYESGHYDVAGFAIGTLTPKQCITGTAIEPGQVVIGLESTGIHSNGLSLARNVLANQPEQLKELLTPTAIYVQPVCQLLEQFPEFITGLAHITGGGWRNLLRLHPHVAYQIDTPLPVLPIFEAMIKAGVSQEEAYKTFNMGMGMAMIVKPAHVQSILSALASSPFKAQPVGKVVEGPPAVSIPHLNITLRSKHQ